MRYDEVWQPRGRDAEANQVKRDDCGQAAEDIAIEDGERTDGLAGLAGHQARQRHDQSPHQHQNFRDDEDEDVRQEELLGDQPPLLLHQRQVEEGISNRHVVHHHEDREAKRNQHEGAPAESHPAILARGGGLDTCLHNVARGEGCRGPARFSKGPDRRNEQQRGRGNDHPKDDLPDATHHAQIFERGTHQMRGAIGRKRAKRGKEKCSGGKAIRALRQGGRSVLFHVGMAMPRHLQRQRGQRPQGLKYGTAAGSLPQAAARYLAPSFPIVPSSIIDCMILSIVALLALPFG